ncbi:MAG: hypothetical protein AAB474_02410 [Patescibacteria group bacterium]
MRYPWTLVTIFGIWVAIAVILWKDVRLDPTNLYLAGVIMSIVLAMIGFKSAA